MYVFMYDTVIKSVTLCEVCVCVCMYVWGPPVMFGPESVAIGEHGPLMKRLYFSGCWMAFGKVEALQLN